MKLSNKILLGFFASILIYLTAAFAELRLTGIPNIINNSNSIAETVNISNVSLLRISGIRKRIDVIGSDRRALEVLSFSGNVLKRLTYKVSGDTLVLSGFQSQDNETVRISIFVPKAGLRGLTVDHSSVSLSGLESEVLDVVQTSADLSISDSRIAKIDMNVSHSSLVISNTNVDSLSARAERSEVNIYSPVGVVQGTMTDGTTFHISDLREILLKKDDSSQLTVSP